MYIFCKYCLNSFVQLLSWQASFLVLPIFVDCSSLLLHDIPWHVYIIIAWTVSLLMDIWAVSSLELLKIICCYKYWGFPGGLEVKASAWNVGDPGSIPGSGRSPGEGNDNPLQYSCLGNPMDRGAWRAMVHGVAKESDTT